MRIRSLLALTVLLAACGGGAATDPVPPPPSGPTTISEVQGTGTTSSFVNQAVTVTGIVTGDFQEDDADTLRNLGGFYLQGIPDGNPRSSDGIFIFDGSNPSVDVNVGDAVEVRGTVNEYFGETQINASSVRVAGTGSVLPLAINLPYPETTANSDGERIADLERYEGMLVEFGDTLTVTDLWTLSRFGEVTLSAGGRLYQFTNDNPPDVAGNTAHREEIARRTIILDDGLRTENPSAIHYLNAGSASGYSIRLGDTLTGLVGNLRYSRGAGANGAEGWRLEPASDPVFHSANPRPVTPGIDGALLVAGMNVLNFFTTVDQGQDGRDALDAEDLSQLGVLVHVHLREDEAPGPFPRLPFEERSELLARAAPGRPEIHQDGHGLRALDDLLLEVLRVDGQDPLPGFLHVAPFSVVPHSVRSMRANPLRPPSPRSS